MATHEQQPKILAIDADWLTTSAMGALCLLCAFMAVGVAWTTLTGRWHAGPPSWELVFLVAYGIWLVFAFRDRLSRFAAGLLVLGPALRTFVWFIRASPQTELIVVSFSRWMDVILWAGGCLYSIVWFKRRIRYV